MIALNKQWMENWQKIVNDDKILKVIGRYFTANVLLEIEDKRYLISVKNGRIEQLTDENADFFQWQFALRASNESWKKFIELMPPPQYNDIWALARHNKMKMEGNIILLWQNLRAFSWMLDLMRKV